MDSFSEESDSNETEEIIIFDTAPRPASPDSLFDDEKDPQEGSADLHTTDCPFCSCLTKVELSDPIYIIPITTEVQYKVFHEECPICLSRNRAHVPLCDFCKHLRLGHLLQCIWNRSRLFRLSINLDLKARALSRTKCDLCNFLTNATSLPQTGSFKLEISLATSATLVIGGWAKAKIRCRTGSPTGDFSVNLKADYYRDDQTDSWLDAERFVQWDVLRRWLSHCNEYHNPWCSLRSQPIFPPGFRVIDVNKRCVVKKEGFCEYVALSYVWGSRSESACYVEQATRDNIESLEVPGGLTQLPDTIEDAITICQKLGIQYLWVDRYCIVQDHAVHKHTQIGAMADIYSSSTVTVIACSGTDGVESGIPGVRRKRQKRSRVNIRDLALSCTLPYLDEIVSRSIWNTRGWTYQEAVLSDRKLIMFPMEVWFECRNDTFRELGHYPDKPIVWNTRLRANPHMDSTEFVDYGPKVTMYTGRKLGYASDVYNAFAGIGQALYARHGGSHFGLPEPHFDEALLWYCGYRWTESDSWCLRDCAEITPSWSWASVTCGVLYEGTFCMSLVKWVLYKAQAADMSSQSSSSETYKAQCIELKAKGEPDTWRRWALEREGPCPQFFLALAMNEGCIPAEKTVISEHERFSSLQEDFTCRWPTYINAYEDVHQTGTHRLFGPNGVLVTNAQSTIFNIQSGWIQNANGMVIGGVCQAKFPGRIDNNDQSKYEENLNDEEDRKYEETLKDEEDSRYEECSNYEEYCDDRECNVEGIALSISEARENHIKHVVKLNNPDISLEGVSEWDELYRDLTYFDCNDEPLVPIPRVDVLFISWEGDYARRIGLGWIALKQWSSFDWTLKEIWLK